MQISDRGFDPAGDRLKLVQETVAVWAEKTSNLSCDVVMVDAQTSGVAGTAADGADRVTSLHDLKLELGKAVTLESGLMVPLGTFRLVASSVISHVAFTVALVPGTILCIQFFAIGLITKLRGLFGSLPQSWIVRIFDLRPSTFVFQVLRIPDRIRPNAFSISLLGDSTSSSPFVSVHIGGMVP